MNRHTCYRWLPALALLVSLAGCSSSPTLGTASVSGTVPTSAVMMSLQPAQFTLPKSVATTAMERAEFDGISFRYDPSIAAKVEARRVPATEHMGAQLPSYVEFDFDPDHTDAFLGREPGIRVFRVEDLEQVNDLYKAGVAAREPMPLINTARTLRVQERPLSFQNGKGIRALVHYTLEPVPLNNRDLFYSYQGVTDDGRFYVSATFPVRSSILPATSTDRFPDGPANAPTNPAQMVEYTDAVERFNAGATEQLEQLEMNDFSPNLRSLDAIIRSLVAREGQGW